MFPVFAEVHKNIKHFFFVAWSPNHITVQRTTIITIPHTTSSPYQSKPHTNITQHNNKWQIYYSIRSATILRKRDFDS